MRPILQSTLLLLLLPILTSCVSSVPSPTLEATLLSPEPTATAALPSVTLTPTWTPAPTRPPTRPAVTGVPSWSVAAPTLEGTPTEAAPCVSGSNVPTEHPNAAFVADLNVPDGTWMAPGTPFVKQWRLRNVGACVWPEGTTLAFVTGYPLPGPERVPVPVTQPGADADVGVALTAPSRRGVYESYWRLQMPNGHPYGAVVFIKIVVADEAVAQPLEAIPTPTAPTHEMPSYGMGGISVITSTLSPTATPDSTATPTPSPTAPPSATLQPSPTVTATADGTGYIACEAPDPRFEPVIEQAARLGIGATCATGPVVEAPGAVQTFWRDAGDPSLGLQFLSLTLHRYDTETIYVLVGEDPNLYQGDARIYDATWTLSMDEEPIACSALSPPEDAIMPTRSVGKVWCENSLWNIIGWPETLPIAATLALQTTSHGFLMEVTTMTGDVTLIAVDLGAKQATTIQ